MNLSFVFSIIKLTLLNEAIVKNDGIKKIAITGGAGQIAYSLLFRIASGELLGKNQKISFSILETTTQQESLRGVMMELEDCAFPLLQEIRFGSDPKELFLDVDFAFLIGASPRGPGMERSDLLLKNAKIFVEQGKALDAVAKKDVIVLVIGNPCNTNCLIAKSFAKRISPKHFFAMTRLDQNRAVAALAKKAGVGVSEVSHLAIWGNHSSSQVPDFLHAKLSGKEALQVLDRSWLEGDFLTLVQKRGEKIIEARGKSSAASASSAALDAMRSLIFPSSQGDWLSMGISSEENPYGIAPGLIFSFPCRSLGDGKLEIIEGLGIDPFMQQKLIITEQELLEEKAIICNLLE